VHLAYNYYLVLAEKYLRQEGSGEGEESNHYSALLAYSLLIMVCSLAETAVDGERVRRGLGSIRQMIITNGYYLWLVNSFFLRISDRLPSQLREMANILDDIILNELIWQEDGIAPEIAGMHYPPSPATKDTPRGRHLQAIVQQLMGKLESHVSRLMAEFNTIDDCGRIEAEVQKTIKYILLYTP
jgi:hypothetical protein